MDDLTAAPSLLVWILIGVTLSLVARAYVWIKFGTCPECVKDQEYIIKTEVKEIKEDPESPKPKGCPPPSCQIPMLRPKMAQLENEVEKMQESIEKLSTLTQEALKISGKKRKNIKSLYLELEAARTDVQTMDTGCEDETSGLRERLNKAANDVATVNDAVARQKAALTSAVKEIKESKEILSVIRDEIDRSQEELGKLKQMKVENEKMEPQINNLQKAIIDNNKKLDSMISKTTVLLTKAQLEVSKLNDGLQLLAVAQDAYNTVGGALENVKDTRAALVDQMRCLMTAEMSAYGTEFFTYDFNEDDVLPVRMLYSFGLHEKYVEGIEELLIQWDRYYGKGITEKFNDAFKRHVVPEITEPYSVTKSNREIRNAKYVYNTVRLTGPGIFDILDPQRVKSSFEFYDVLAEDQDWDTRKFPKKTERKPWFHRRSATSGSMVKNAGWVPGETLHTRPAWSDIYADGPSHSRTTPYPKNNHDYENMSRLFFSKWSYFDFPDFGAYEMTVSPTEHEVGMFCTDVNPALGIKGDSLAKWATTVLGGSSANYIRYKGRSVPQPTDYLDQDTICFYFRAFREPRDNGWYRYYVMVNGKIYVKNKRTIYGRHQGIKTFNALPVADSRPRGYVLFDSKKDEEITLRMQRDVEGNVYLSAKRTGSNNWGLLLDRLGSTTVLTGHWPINRFKEGDKVVNYPQKKPFFVGPLVMASKKYDVILKNVSLSSDAPEIPWTSTSQYGQNARAHVLSTQPDRYGRLPVRVDWDCDWVTVSTKVQGIETTRKEAEINRIKSTRGAEFNACVSEEKKRMKDPKELTKTKNDLNVDPLTNYSALGGTLAALSASICTSRLYYKYRSREHTNYDCGNGFRTRGNVKPIGAGYNKWKPAGPMVGCAKYCECSFSSESQGVPHQSHSYQNCNYCCKYDTESKTCHRMGEKTNVGDLSCKTKKCYYKFK
jgi:hypothetical protein